MGALARTRPEARRLALTCVPDGRTLNTEAVKEEANILGMDKVN